MSFGGDGFWEGLQFVFSSQKEMTSMPAIYSFWLLFITYYHLKLLELPWKEFLFDVLKVFRTSSFGRVGQNRPNK